MGRVARSLELLTLPLPWCAPLLRVLQGTMLLRARSLGFGPGPILDFDDSGFMRPTHPKKQEWGTLGPGEFTTHKDGHPPT